MLRFSVHQMENAAGAPVFRTAWQGPLPGELKTSMVPHEPGEAAAPERGVEAVLAQLTPHEAHLKGHQLVTWVLPAFAIGIGLGIGLYLPGYRIASRIVRVPPLGWIHAWLYRRMYFDELYQWVFVNVTVGLAYLSRWFDEKVVDRLVNTAAATVRRASAAAGLHDRYVIDGAVNGVGSLAHNVGAA